MKTLLCTVLIACSVSAHAQEQNPDYLRVFTSRPLLFTFSNIDELLNPKTIDNAIELQLKPTRHTRNISAHVNFIGVDNNALPHDWVSLRLSNRTPSNAIFRTTETKLGVAPALLFSQPGSKGEELYSFNYDIILNPLSTFTKTGHYSFSITFTMTEP